MRPLRFLLLLAFFIVLPTILTCLSLFAGGRSDPQDLNIGYDTRDSRFRALFSFISPSSLFPPAAVISLTNDNTTSFFARPANFGPRIPPHGLSGELWVGKGFGEDFLLSDEELRLSGFELGCSDVPGWVLDSKKRPESGTMNEKAATKNDGGHTNAGHSNPQPKHSKRHGTSSAVADRGPSVDDGTDDYLHHPLPDSNPAPVEKPGEPAGVGKQDKGKPPTHADIESLQESADIAGKVVMLSRGGCGFLEKVKWAQRRGAIAVIVSDSRPSGHLIVMDANGDKRNVTIPAIFTSYYSAQALSSLVPAEQWLETGNMRALSGKEGKSTQRARPGNAKVPVSSKHDSSNSENVEDTKISKDDKGWVYDVLSVVGLGEDERVYIEDNRRPPSSGNIDWVQVQDWDEDKPALNNINLLKLTMTAKKAAKTSSASSENPGNDNFIIGVHDWRDTELIAPKATATQRSKNQKGKADTTALQASLFSSSVYPAATAIRGGIITPGSGEYDHQKENKDKVLPGKSSVSSTKAATGREHASLLKKLASLLHIDSHKDNDYSAFDEHASDHNGRVGEADTDPTTGDDRHHGLWVTLHRTNPTTSPFFDTLLVLVVSPLVTLTFVYGLLLLRSRIRRRRWRAPKSLVERLPVRTYQTMSTTSSSTSSLLNSPQQPTATPSSYALTNPRPRPRSQTTGSMFNSSTPTEKTSIRSSPKYKRYTGRQVECVVCLEEYVDGESQVMSLPCGHEFHAECITPWLVTRRRTCPICKGDVVRTLARATHDSSNVAEDMQEEDEQRSDDVQERAAMTQNSSASAAIPIPVLEDTSASDDIERDGDVETPLLGATPRAQQNRWRGMLSGSWGRLSGDTVWRSSVHDQNR